MSKKRLWKISLDLGINKKLLFALIALLVFGDLSFAFACILDSTNNLASLVTLILVIIAIPLIYYANKEYLKQNAKIGKLFFLNYAPAAFLAVLAALLARREYLFVNPAYFYMIF